MPPRRARASLPTPAGSTASSVSDAPARGRRKTVAAPSAAEHGLITPTSITGTSDDREESVELDLEVEVTSAEDEAEAAPAPVRAGTSAGERDGPWPSYMRGRAAPRSGQRQPEVVVPGRRSKLALEQTTSLDNLTLDPTASRKAGRTSSGIKLENDADEHAVKEELDTANASAPAPSVFKARRNGRGKVKIEPTETPALVRASSSTKSGVKGKAAAKSGKPAVKAESESEDDLLFETSGSGRYRLQEANSDDRDLFGIEIESSTKWPTYKPNLKRNVSSRSLLGKAAAKRAGIADTTGTTTPGSRSVTTLSRASSSTGVPFFDDGMSDSDIAASEAPEGQDSSLSSFSDSDSAFTDESAPKWQPKKKARVSLGRAKPVKPAPKAKAAKGKGKAKSFPGKGQKLDPDAEVGVGDMSGSEADEAEDFGMDLDDSEEDDDEDDGVLSDVSAIDYVKLKKMKPDVKLAYLAERGERLRRRTKKASGKGQREIAKKRKLMRDRLGRKLTNGENNLVALQHHHTQLHDVWGDLTANIKPVKPVTMEAHPSLKLTLLPFQKESLYWMKKQEEGQWKGGMLADEMGMGKTIQTIALLLSEPRRKPSLVVAPVVALMQWKHEIETHAEGFTVCLWHGQGRLKADDLKKFDVVLVSYGTLETAFRRQQRGFQRKGVLITEKSPMHAFEWYRVILDEAHNIKERSTNAAKAAFALKAQYRWCLSGTPLQNRVGELYSLVRFLGADPFSSYFCKKCDCKSLHWEFSDRRHCDQCGHKPMDHVCFWNTEILTPIAKYGIEAGNPGHTAFRKLKILLDRMMLRRTKLERADDLGLPPRTIVVRRDYFSPEEKELYMSLFTNAKRQFSTYINAGTVLNNYSNIFSLITRMRQMACHPDLVLKSRTSALAQQVEENTVCRLCNDTAEDAIVSACKHLFDRSCITQYLEVQQTRGHRPECPVCHIEISIDLEQEAVDLGEDNSKKARQGILSRLDVKNWRSSTKLEALVEELEKLRGQDCTIKSLVFSQFVSFLDLIAFRLQRAGFTICRLEGGMTPQQRDATIQHFMKNTNVTVFLISLKAGGVALNLTEASMVFMMDSWWNPSVEYQAMDRIHRLGQKRPVKVVKLVVEDSIEDQIVQLQHKKLAMTEAALSTDPDAALGKLTVEDLGFLFKM